MSEDSKSFERKLDRDFLSYLTLTKGLYDKIQDEAEKQLCEVWLTHLVGKNICSLREKCDRNIFLSRLLLQMQNGKLQGIFQESPPDDTLPCAFSTFGLPGDVEGIKGFEESGFQVDSTIGGGSGDFSEVSRDGRTFLATRKLPQGMMAYIAVTNNDGQEIWRPQTCSVGGTSQGPESKSQLEPPETSEFVKKIAQFVKVPLCGMRKSPEERESVLEWMDKIIDACNKWIIGEDPHNMDLESLFEMMYQDYKNDPDKQEILKHPKKLRTVLMKDIRDQMAQRRAEISKRELVLDQYESEQYVEERLPGQQLDEVWLQCAKKPLSESTKANLELIYPPEVIARFFELLIQERIYIIEKGEKAAKKKIAELRSGSMDDVMKELQKLKKIQQDYKEYFAVYKEAEVKEAEYAREWREKCSKSDKADSQQKVEKLKKEIECEIEQSKRNYNKERKCQIELAEKLEEAKEIYHKFEEKTNVEAEILSCERNQLQKQKRDLIDQIQELKKKQENLRCKLLAKKNKCSF